ncbi:MAG: AAA family ATPase [Patescibacteria group bacterium]|jgi:hypothetical protein
MVSDKSVEFYKKIIHANSPWIQDPSRLIEPEAYRREAFFQVKKELSAPHGNAVLIKGPRRVGKTETQRQLIQDLVQSGVSPKFILYLSFDDLQIISERPDDRARTVQHILDAWAEILGFDMYDEIAVPAYCFFDEVQEVKDWAHLVKNRIERNHHVRIVLSGSAAHSIFEKALKILLGRVIDVKLAPFSFREYLEMNKYISQETLAGVRQVQLDFERGLNPVNLYNDLKTATMSCDATKIRTYISEFLLKGGFPQLWKMDQYRQLETAQFMDDNYVKKVTLEDLMLLQSIKKPELYERLLRHLFARPGQEYSQQKVAVELGTTTVTLAEGMRLLEQTDLLIFVEKFSLRAEPLKRRNIKVYPVDLMLTTAMTKVIPQLETLEKGMIAESLVAQTTHRLKNLSALAFMQSDDVRFAGEIDFYLRADMHDCPVEVKYQTDIRGQDIAALKRVVGERGLIGGILVTVDEWHVSQNIYSIPLWAFMLLA